MGNRLEFRGKWTDIFGPLILIGLAAVFTLGIAVPWAFVSYRKKVLGMTYYKNSPLYYDGKGGEYFGELFVGFLFTLFTLGLYSLLGFYQARLLRYDCSHTILPGGKRMEFRGKGLDLFAQYLLIGILSTITLGIYSFWGYTRMRRIILEHTFVENKPLQFSGNGSQFLGISIVIIFLTIVTLGIYQFLCIGQAKILRWDCENTLVPDLIN